MSSTTVKKKKTTKVKKKQASSSTSGRDDITELAFQKIKQMMYRNELLPGQKIFYRDIAKKLGMSITPIVTALGKLSILKLVSYEQNRGYFVRMINEEETRELYKAREALEVYIVPDVIKKINAENLNSIKEAFKEHVSTKSPYYRRMVLMRDLDLHLKMAEIAGNKVIYDLLKEVFERIYLGYRPEYVTDDRVKKVVKEHRNILDALERRDTDGAIQCVRKHINNGMDYILQSIVISRSEEGFLDDYTYGQML